MMPSQKTNPLSRRQFLKLSATTLAGLIASGCIDSSFNEIPVELTQSPPAPTSAPATILPPTTPAGEETQASTTASVPWNPIDQVATGFLGRGVEYELSPIKTELQGMLDSLGGVKDVVPFGGKVVIKVNLTGGVKGYQMNGLPAVETIATHPSIVQAVGELLLDAGAGELFIAEAITDWASFEDWGYTEVAKKLNAKLVDLNRPDPYPDFTQVETGPGWTIYDKFTFNRLLQECDAMVSIAKMKCHIECGVTHTMKNLVGLVPYQLYARQEGDGWRSEFHGAPEETPTRLPRVVVDLNLARPAHLAIIDGIKTIEAGEGTWAEGVQQVTPGVLVAGKNSVGVDAIATAIQGFDPTADMPNAPFYRAVNHLNLAYELGLGTNRLYEIEVLGPAVEELVTPFKPATGYR